VTDPEQSDYTDTERLALQDKRIAAIHQAIEDGTIEAVSAPDIDAAIDAEPWPPEAQPDHQPDTAGKRIRYDTKGFPHLIDGEMDQPIRWTDTH
jgi:hypothetical protein